MPELPDVAILADALDVVLSGRPLTGSKIAQSLVLRGTPAELAAFEGQTLLDIKRRGSVGGNSHSALARVVASRQLNVRRSAADGLPQ